MITSSSNPRLKRIVQWQTRQRQRRKDGVFIAEGFKMYEEAPENSILEVYLSETVLDKTRENTLIWKKLNKTGYEILPEAIFLKISDTQTPQGILTVLRQPKYTLEEMIRAENPLLLILENLQDPGNLGTIMRTAEGAGITGVIMSAGTVDIFNPKTVRGTMGSIYRVPFVYVENLESAMDSMHKMGIHTYAAHLEGEAYYSNLSFRQPTAFLIGNEGNGLTKETAELAEGYLKIPMEGQLESLNAAVAAALLMYEAHRQRKG